MLCVESIPLDGGRRPTKRPLLMINFQNKESGEWDNRRKAKTIEPDRCSRDPRVIVAAKANSENIIKLKLLNVMKLWA